MFVDEYGAVSDGMCSGLPVRRVKPPWCRMRYIVVNHEPSMTQQSHYDQTDVNAIVERFKRTGYMPQGRSQQAQYADVTAYQRDLTDMYNESVAVMDRAMAFAQGWIPPEERPVPPIETEGTDNPK